MIRAAGPGDVPEILAMIRELATYERAPEQVEATEEALHLSLFGPTPAVFCHLAEHEGAPAGFALWFLSFSTWLGTHGVYLEDLFVRPAYRRHGYGAALLRTLAAITVERGYGRMEWSVLDWNVDAHGFYRAIGAVPMDEWTTWRATGPALRELAAQPE